MVVADRDNQRARPSHNYFHASVTKFSLVGCGASSESGASRRVLDKSRSADQSMYSDVELFYFQDEGGDEGLFTIGTSECGVNM